MRKILITLTIITALMFTMFQTKIHAYNINTPQVYNSWIDTGYDYVLIDGKNYYEYYLDANQPSAQTYILFYMLRENQPLYNDFGDVEYISLDGGITKIGLNYLSLGDAFVYQTYNASIQVYTLASNATPLETTLNFLNRYLSIYVGTIYDFLYVANADQNEVAYNRGYDKGKTDGQAVGYDLGFQSAYDLYYQSRWQVGYNEGLADGQTSTSLFPVILSIPFMVISDMMTIEILPGVYSGYIAGIFILFGLMAFFFAIKGGKK